MQNRAGHMNVGGEANDWGFIEERIEGPQYELDGFVVGGRVRHFSRLLAPRGDRFQESLATARVLIRSSHHSPRAANPSIAVRIVSGGVGHPARGLFRRKLIRSAHR